MMTAAPWLVQIFRISDAQAQELIAGLLSGVADLSVEATDDGFSHYVIVESRDHFQASSVSRMVTAIDVDAVLLHTATGTPAGTDARQRLAAVYAR